MNDEQITIELGAHTFEFVNQRFWHARVQGEEAVREFASTTGLQAAMDSFGRLEFPEEGGTVEWLVSRDVARQIREVTHRSMLEGEVRVFSLAVVSLMEQTRELEG